MNEATQKMFGLLATLFSIFLLIGGLYLPSDFIADPLRTALTSLGLVLLIGGNIIMSFAHDKD